MTFLIRVIACCVAYAALPDGAPVGSWLQLSIALLVIMLTCWTEGKRDA